MRCEIGCAAVLAVAATGTRAGAEQNAEWSYEGETGPAHWAALSPEYAAAAGRNQSPMDLVTKDMIEAELEPLEFEYAAVPLEVINNGHTIQ
jgi:carbonic anhydrase